MNCGTLLYDDEFQFSDGTTLNKLIIILCEYGHNYLAALTTSKQHSKGKNEGCQINDIPSNYFISESNNWFNKDTWVVLDEIYGFKHFQLQNGRRSYFKKA